MPKQVQKGDIRNTVLKQLKTISQSIKFLGQGLSIKEKEIKENNNAAKKKKLKIQVSIIKDGITKLENAVGVLSLYKRHNSK